MCGILGIFVRDRNLYDPKKLERGLKYLHHRGPDGSGVKEFNLDYGRLGFAHARLSIIDLSLNARQPMSIQDGRYTIIFNGEIYNYCELRQELKNYGYIFSTESDTEVLLISWAHWGVESLKKFKGMFAFAIFDKTDASLTLVRDAFGIKPLFYLVEKNGVFFGSEIFTLISILPEKPNINIRTSYNYLVSGEYDGSSETFIDNINQIEPGHILKINLKNNKIDFLKRWWWPEIENQSNLSFIDAADKVRNIFLENIKLHLRSDVSIGAALSGGIDSSAVACVMRYLEPDIDIHTFSYVAKGTNINEEKWIDIVNKKINAIPHKISINYDDLNNDLDRLVLSQGEPFGSTSIYAQYRVFQLAKENNIKVTLDGQGADELFGGYNGYPGSVMKSMVELGKWRELIYFLINWSSWPGRTTFHGMLALINQYIPPFMKRRALEAIGKSLSPNWIDKNIANNYSKSLIKKNMDSDDYSSSGRRLASTLRDSLTKSGLSSLLRHGDRNSMHWSIESRVPFLTTELAEFTLQLPENYLVSNKGETKSIFREAMRGIVPDDILDRKDKIGFQTPENSWLNGANEKINDYLDIASEIPLFNKDKIRKEILNIEKKQSNNNHEYWRIINYCLWYKEIKGFK